MVVHDPQGPQEERLPGDVVFALVEGRVRPHSTARETLRVAAPRKALSEKAVC